MSGEGTIVEELSEEGVDADVELLGAEPQVEAAVAQTSQHLMTVAEAETRLGRGASGAGSAF